MMGVIASFPIHPTDSREEKATLTQYFIRLMFAKINKTISLDIQKLYKQAHG
jgi:hypothetical protein